MSNTLQLGLIGDNIVQSRSPLFHQLAGRQNGVTVSYERLIPKVVGLDFGQIFAKCAASGYRGFNVTYPYKEHAINFVKPSSSHILDMGAINTVLFTSEGPVGYNTDFSGFVAAYRSVRGSELPGVVCMVGAGGVGKAVAFGLAELGASEIRIVDLNLERAEALADQLRAAGSSTMVKVMSDVVEAANGASGLINCTPVGMVGIEGTPVPISEMKSAEWAFDAVYTPVDTQFLLDAKKSGIEIISGYELFFFQAVHAWKLFSDLPLDEPAMRLALIENKDSR